MWVDRRESLSFNDLRFNGAMAQLGARLHGMQKVASSSLAGSNKLSGRRPEPHALARGL